MEESAPKIPKAMCRIAHEFLPQIRSEGSAHGIDLSPTGEKTVADQGQDTHHSKRQCQDVPDQGINIATNASVGQGTVSRKRSLSPKDMDCQLRLTASNNIIRQPEKDGKDPPKSRQKQKGWEWTPTIRRQESARQRSRDPRGDQSQPQAAGKSVQQISQQSKRTSQSSYIPQSRFYDIREKKKSPS
jgi:hypothetical protein